MSNGSITPAQVNAFIARQSLAATEARGIMTGQVVLPPEEGAAPPSPDGLDPAATPSRAASSAQGSRASDLDRVDEALIDMDPFWEVASGQSIVQLGEHLSRTEEVELQQVHDCLEADRLKLPSTTRQLLAALFFAQAKPEMLEALITDLYDVQQILEQARASGLEVELCRPDQARDYLAAARQHAEDSLWSALPLLAALPPGQKQDVAQLLGSDGSYFGSLPPFVSQLLLAALKVK